MTAEASGAVEAERRKAEASPPLSEWKKRFGDKVKVDERSGSFTLSLHDRADIRAAYEMQEGIRKVEVERGREVKSRWDGKRERVVNRKGEVVEVREDLVDRHRDRFRPVGKGRSAPALHFNIGDAASRYEKGPDGLWFVWRDGWEPTNLWRNGAVSPQRDPDENRWVERDGEWVLESEVA